MASGKRKRGVNGRHKGNRGELEVCALLQPWWQRYEPRAEFERVPLSGGWKKDSVIRVDFAVCGDLMTNGRLFPFCVEVKYREKWGEKNLFSGKPTPPWEWWRQAITAAVEQKSVPMMWMRKTRLRAKSGEGAARRSFPWLVWIPHDFCETQRLSEPDVRWTSSLLRANDVDYGGVLPVVYIYDRFLEMAAKRMLVKKDSK